MTSPKQEIRKVALTLRKFPPKAYRLPGDGRKWKHKCVLRQRVAERFASYANPDGTNVTVGIETIAEQLDLAKSTVNVVIEELMRLGFVINTGWDRKTHTRIRRLDLLVLKSPGLVEEESGIEQEESEIGAPRVQDSHDKSPGLGRQESGIGVEESGIEESEIRVKALDSEVTANPGLQTAFTVHTDTHRFTEQESEACVVCVLEHPTTVEYSWSPTSKDRSEMRNLALNHGREKFLAAYDYFAKHAHEKLDAKTKFPFKFFISGFEGYAKMAETAAKSQSTTPEQIAATNALATYNNFKERRVKLPMPFPDLNNYDELIAWEKKVFELPESVRMGRTEEREPGPEALFENTSQEE